jgi:hypothetical protein
MAGLTNGLSDKVLSVFVFTACHEPVSRQKIIRRDHAGYTADPDGIAKLERHGLHSE